MIADGDAVMSNIFYRTIPGNAGGPLFWIMFILAILATVSGNHQAYIQLLIQTWGS